MRMLYVGASWLGSSARSVREAMARVEDVLVGDLAEDHYVPTTRSLALRVAYRLLHRWQVAELSAAIKRQVDTLRPDVLMVYKGYAVAPDVIHWANARGVLTVNVFPDASPLLHSRELRESIGLYGLVVSTKPYHPRAWRTLYGFQNRCECIPHGYDPKVHLWNTMATDYDADLVLAATWRPQYHELLRALAAEPGMDTLRVAVMGEGWTARGNVFPASWRFEPGQHGRSYGEWLRRGRIALAPVHAEMHVNGSVHPGDEETTRTYELAAAHCFFLHRRTPFVRTLYDETTEVPMWDDTRELASHVRQFLGDDAARERMAAAAHARAVPAYSIESRTRELLRLVRSALETRA